LYGQRGRDDDVAQAKKRWQEVVDAAAHQGNLAGLLQSVRARVYLEKSVEEAGQDDLEIDDGVEN
jgi:hypothetical protein